MSFGSQNLFSQSSGPLAKAKKKGNDAVAALANESVQPEESS